MVAADIGTHTMKVFLIALAAAAAVTVAAGSASAGDVTVTLTGVQARGGELLVGLQTSAQFMKHEGVYGERIEHPAAGTRTFTLHDVAPGDYSLTALHDEDGDKDMKMVNGRPAEGWGMVHGETLRAIPTFDQVKFTVPASGNITVTVAMDYPAQ
jgi:uncharacterized protein (DUF2141 family)